jgi:hypothetical protein
MRRCVCAPPRLVLKRWGQQSCSPCGHLRGEDGSGMPWQPDLLLIAPDMVGQTAGPRWGARRAPLAQALGRPHNVGEAAQAPALPPGARAAPGQTPGAAPQGCAPPPQGAIPPVHNGRLDRLPALPDVSRLAKTARAAIHAPPAALHAAARWGAALAPLGVDQGWRRPKPGLRLAAHWPTPPRTLHAAHAL